MTNGKCPNCGSKNIYKSQNTSWSRDGINIQTLGDNLTEVFADCRKLHIYMDENSVVIFGKGKPLNESV